MFIHRFFWCCDSLRALLSLEISFLKHKTCLVSYKYYLQNKSNQFKIYIFFYIIYKVVISVLYAKYIVINVWEGDLEVRP